ncbi:unnamed protein product [Leptosia nina]|uniref:Uncharacterized protein n=1 Tax=Leptosia nina TaxID=320188 RepID=A0AAV1J091_9NEOP
MSQDKSWGRSRACLLEVGVRRGDRRRCKGGGVSRGGKGGSAGAVPRRVAHSAARREAGETCRVRAMVARTDEMFGCYGDSYSYRLWSLANVWGCRCE